MHNPTDALSPTTIAKELLSDCASSEPVVYIPNPGMAGDALLATATYQLFKSVGLRYSVVADPTASSVNGRTVIYGAGGNLIPYYNNGAQLLTRILPEAQRVIVLPHTVYGHTELLKQFDDKVTVACREPVSYAFVKEHSPNAQVHLMHDLALDLATGDLLTHRPIGLIAACVHSVLSRDRALPGPGHLIHRHRLALRRTFLSRGARQTLDAFRVDSAERTSDHWPVGNVDVAWMFDYGTHSERTAFEATCGLLHYLQRFSLIRTNRLHTAIAAALLGKQVELFPNSYFKCEQIYRFSLRHRFRNVQWMGTTDSTLPPRIPEGPAFA